MLLRLRYLLVFVVVVIAMAACQDNGNDDSNTNETTQQTPATQVSQVLPTPTILPVFTEAPLATPVQQIDILSIEGLTPQEVAGVRLIHAMTEDIALDVYLENQRAASNLRSTSIVSSNLRAGTYTLRAEESGNPANVYLSESVTFAPETSQIIILQGDSASGITLKILSENLEPVDPGILRLAFLNLAPDVVDASVWNREAETKLTPDADFGEITAPLSLSPDEFSLSVRLNEQELAAVSQDLAGGAFYTVLLQQNAQRKSYSALILRTETPPQTKIRFVHAAIGVDAINLTFDERSIAQNVAYGDLRDFQSYLSQSYTVRIVASAPSAGTDPLLLESSITFAPNQTVDLVLFGTADDLRLSQFPLDTTPTPNDGVRIQVINAYPGDTSGRVFSSTGPAFPEALIPYGTASQPILLSTGQPLDFYFESSEATGTRLIENTSQFELVAGTIYTYIPTGSSASIENPIVLSFTIGTTDQNVAVSTNLDNQQNSDVFAEGKSFLRVMNVLEVQEGFAVYLNNEEVVSFVPWGGFSEQIELPYGLVVVEVRRRDGVVMDEVEIIIEEGNVNKLLIVMGTLEVARLRLSDELNEDIRSDRVLVQFVHATAALPRLLITYKDLTGTGSDATPSPETDALVAVDALPPFTVSENVTLPAGVIGLNLISRDGDGAEYNERIVLEGGSYYQVLFLSQGDGLYEVQVLKRR